MVTVWKVWLAVVTVWNGLVTVWKVWLAVVTVWNGLVRPGYGV